MLKFKYDFFTIISSLLILFTATPFFLLGNTAIYSALITALYIVCFFVYVNRYPIKLTKYKYEVSVISLLFFIYLALPFREFDRFLFVNIWLLIFITFIYIDSKHLVKIIQCLSDIIFIICLGAVFVIFLKIIGINLPKWEYNTGLADVKKSVYYIYPGTSELIYQNYDVFGRSLFRVSGIFSEPGHFGVICASFLYINPILFPKWKRNIILIAGLLSLSMGFYVLLTISLLIKSKFNLKQVLYFVVLTIIITISIALLPEEFVFRFFGNKINTDSDVLDARSSLDFTSFYSGIVYTKDWYFGAGSIVLPELNLTNSDYRAFIAKYGVFGMIFFLIWFYKVNVFKIHERYFYLGFCFFVIILAHRSWLASSLIFYFMVYSIIFSYKRNNINE